MHASEQSEGRLASLVLGLEAGRQPEALFAAVDAAIEHDAGRLFCTYLLLHANGDGERVYTTVPQQYPNGGRKPLQGTDWGNHVLKQGRIFLSRTQDELRSTYATWTMVEELGCTALANVPVIHGGEVLGTINLGHRVGHYTDEALERLKPYAALLGPAFALIRARQH